MLEDYLGSFYLITIAIGIAIMVYIYSFLKEMVIKYKYKTAIKIFRKYGFKFYSYYNYKGKGLIYTKQIELHAINSLLINYNFEPLNINNPFKVFDFIAIMEYPEWEERCYNLVARHGGLRFIHLYMLEVEIGGKIFGRPLYHYLNQDGIGEAINKYEFEDSNYVESILSSDMYFILKNFNEEEIQYWENKLTKLANIK